MSAALFFAYFFFHVFSPSEAESEIYEHDVEILLWNKHKILGFEVSMGHFVRMTIVYDVDHLGK